MATKLRNRWHRAARRIADGIAATVVIGGAIAWALEQRTMDDTAGKARARLSSIVAIEDDNDFLAACIELLGEFGLDVPLVFGDRLVVGGGFMLLNEKSKGAEWVLLDSQGDREVRIPKGRFVKFLHDGKMLDAAPAPTPNDGVAFVGVDDAATFVDMRTGRVRRLPMTID